MSLSVLRRCLFHPRHLQLLGPSRTYKISHETDACGIPVKPTWSIHELLSSYPSPTLSSATLTRLHELSALVPPAEGTPEHAKLKKELEEFVRLVEAVRLVNTDGVEVVGGREYTDGPGFDTPKEDVSGRALLHHASLTKDGFYVVETDRKR